MSGTDSERSGPTRRGFGVILGGLAAGAVLGTTVVAHADEDEQAVHNTGVGSTTKRKRPAQRRGVDRHDVDSLAAKLDALDLSPSERALLVGLLSVATDAIVRSDRDPSASPLLSSMSGPGPLIEVRTQGSMPSVRDQFRAAFIPGAAPPLDAPEFARKREDP
jgi:hypothetical protein